MAKYAFIILFLSIISSAMMSATFVPLSIEQQLRDASGVIRGIYLGSSYKKTSDGRVITESSFKIKTMSGIKNHEIINKNSFKIIYPGGKWQGVNHQVSAAPTFIKNEEVVLMVSKTSRGFVPTNLALGKYSIKKEFGKEYITSSVFPNMEKLKSIPIEKFNELLNETFGSSLEIINQDKFVFKGNKKKVKTKESRRPASIQEAKSDNNDGMLWLVLLFSSLGFSSFYFARQRNKK